MIEQAAPVTHLSRGMDYLGELGARLRDLQGYTTLAYELIQNAEDSNNATWISFDVRVNELVVDNDGTFSDCGRVEEHECPWKSDTTRDGLCDFHGFRTVAAGHKREVRNTIGAFGVGFTSVYQITDAPHLISAGRHWIINEEKDEDHRITVCHGCAVCRAKDIPGTRFMLPWAKNATSELRRRLRADPVRPDIHETFPAELSGSLAESLLFLQHVSEIRIRKDGHLQTKIVREPRPSGFVITNGKAAKHWYVLRGDFHESGGNLKREHIGRIEAKRSSEVAIAVPAEPMKSGLLFAFLPSQHTTGLGFHINADFYPASDRKRINFEGGYERTWNTEAVRAAASALSANLTELRGVLGHKQFWTVVNSCYDVAINKRDSFFTDFWRSLEPELKTADIVYTSTKLWKPATDCRITRENSEHIALPLLQDMGINLAHEDLRFCYSPLISIGVGLVEISDITSALESHGLTTSVKHADLPSWIRSKESLSTLWTEIAQLLRRAEKKARKEAEQKLKQYAIAPSFDRDLWPCGNVYRADEKTVALFRELDAAVPFLSKTAPDVEEVLTLMSRLDAHVAAEKLSVLKPEQIAKAGEKNSSLIPGLIRWFETSRQAIVSSNTLKANISNLPIFPTASGPKPLSKLSLPGGFTDHLGLANLVDVAALQGRTDFLSDLGAKKLTFEQYVLVHIPEAWESRSLSTETKLRVVELIALRLGEIRDNERIKNVLQRIELVQCTDGAFRRASDAYFSSELVQAVLGTQASYLQLPDEHKEALSDLYTWLGSQKEPDLSDVIAHVEAVTSVPANAQSKKVIDICMNYLGDLFSKDSIDKHLFDDLKTLRWLPGPQDDNSWYAAEKVYTFFRRSIFSSQGKFLGLSATTQKNNSDFLKFIGVPTDPTPQLVVKHLDYCAANELPLKMDMYSFLSEHSENPIVLSLRTKPCLLIGENRYVRPDKAFWGSHPFGRMRIQLTSEWRTYNDLLTKLGVKESPNAADAISIISEIADDFGRDNRPLEDWAYSALLAAWAKLDSALQADEIDTDYFAPLRNLKVIPNIDNVLQRTEGVLFEDRSGLAAKFGSFLTTSAIPRPSEAWRAMAAAGVQTLSQAVEVEIIECEDPVVDPDVLAVLQRRSNELARVLDAHMDGQDPRSLQKLLQELRCERVAGLSIRFTISAFNQVRHSAPEDVPALYQPESRTMYFVQQGTRMPWPSMARELALALFPDEEPGRLAPGFKEVLSAESDEAARETLDELGFASVVIVNPSTDSEEISGVLGAEESDEEFDVSDESVPSGESTAPDQQLTPEEAVSQILGALAQPTALPPELDQAEPAGSAQGGSQSNRHAGTSQSQSRNQGRLRSYVVKGDSKNTEPNSDAQKHRTEVDKAGIECVKLFEEAQGRVVDIKPHTHEGYDIESKDAAGKIVRYIEVKSLSGVWGTRGVSVHRSQFKFAQKLGTEYWLYVVENALSSRPAIHRIPDPARKVDDFLFDYDWHEIAEGDVTNE
jgi:hypothetical protein